MKKAKTSRQKKKNMLTSDGSTFRYKWVTTKDARLSIYDDKKYFYIAIPKGLLAHDEIDTKRSWTLKRLRKNAFLLAGDGLV